MQGVLHRRRSIPSVGLVTAILMAGALPGAVGAQSGSPPSQSPASADWGPLAVLDDPTAADHLDAGNGPGRVRIRQDCVVLRGAGGHEDTLAWRSGDTRWDAAQQEVVFRDVQAGEIRVSDGDRVTLGGFGFTLGGPVGGPPVVWLVPPASTCPTSIWVVHEIRTLGGGPKASTAPPKRTSRSCIRAIDDAPGGKALRSDLRAIARANRWTMRQAETNHCSTEAIDRVSAGIHAEAPDLLVGGVVSADPMGTPSIWIKGPAPELVHRLVDAESIPIDIVDGQPFSFTELEARAQQVADALLVQGYGGVVVATDLIGSGRIPASVVATPGLPDDPGAILLTLPDDLRPHIVLTVSRPPFE